jgi:hypothetical protein
MRHAGAAPGNRRRDQPPRARRFRRGRHDRHAGGGLARELAIPYAAINVVANYAAGRGDSHGHQLEAIHERPEGGDAQVQAIIETMLNI